MLTAWPALADAAFAQIALTARAASKDSSWIASPRNALPALDHALLAALSELPTAASVSPMPFSMPLLNLASAVDL